MAGGNGTDEEKDEEMPAANLRVSPCDCELSQEQLPELALRPDRKRWV